MEIERDLREAQTTAARRAQELQAACREAAQSAAESERRAEEALAKGMLGSGMAYAGLDCGLWEMTFFLPTKKWMCCTRRTANCTARCRVPRPAKTSLQRLGGWLLRYPSGGMYAF